MSHVGSKCTNCSRSIFVKKKVLREKKKIVAALVSKILENYFFELNFSAPPVYEVKLIKMIESKKHSPVS